jgi:hypothetical protein
MNTVSCIKVFLNGTTTCTNAFSATVGWIGSPGLSCFAASRSSHSPIAGNNFLQRLVGLLGRHVQDKRIDHLRGDLPLIAPILLEGWGDMRRLLLCCSIGLGVVFDPCSHTRYPPYELRSRNWYVSFCWTFRRREGLADRFPMRRVRPFLCLAGRFYLHSELSPSYAQDSSQGFRESPAISVLIARKIQHIQIGSVPVVLSVAFTPYEKSHFFLYFHFLLDEISNTYSNFTERNMCFLSIEVYKWGFSLLDGTPSSEGFPSAVDLAFV